MTICEICHRGFNPWKCPKCDGRLENDREGTIYCSECSHTHEYGYLMCPRCGHLMHGYAWQETRDMRFNKGHRSRSDLIKK